MTTYKEAGVDIDKGNNFVQRLQQLAPEIGGFAGLYPYGDDYLVACTDGVGTKLKLAFALDKHDTIGQDLVAMCVNDLVTVGARPLFFLDYYATAGLDVVQAEAVLGGVVAGCQEAGCVLLGGETAEMPGIYHQGEYDICGFSVGSVPQKNVIDGTSIAAGDCILGLPSSGVHSNGFSLIRKIFSDCNEPLNSSIGERLLVPTRIYVSEILELLSRHTIQGIAHITGGGIEENIARILPQGLRAKIMWEQWEEPPLFSLIKEMGAVPIEDMRRTFNMGIGMVLVVRPDEYKAIIEEREYIYMGAVEGA